MSVTDAVEARKRGDLQALFDLLTDTDPLTRSAAAQGLGALGDPEAVTPLLRCLQASGDGLRVSAVKALAQIGEPSVIPTLLDVAENDEASGVRVTAVDALASLGDARGVEMLTRLALDPLPLIETSLRWFRIETSVGLYRPPLAILSSRRKEVHQTRRWALKRLRELHAVAALPALETSHQPASPLLRLRRRRTIRALRSQRP